MLTQKSFESSDHKSGFLHLFPQPCWLLLSRAIKKTPWLRIPETMQRGSVGCLCLDMLIETTLMVSQLRTSIYSQGREFYVS